MPAPIKTTDSETSDTSGAITWKTSEINPSYLLTLSISLATAAQYHNLLPNSETTRIELMSACVLTLLHLQIYKNIYYLKKIVLWVLSSWSSFYTTIIYFLFYFTFILFTFIILKKFFYFQNDDSGLVSTNNFNIENFFQSHDEKLKKMLKYRNHNAFSVT